jgi:transposase
MTCPEVAKLLGDAPRSAEYWLRRFEEKGLAGLQEGERGGRPRRLSEKQLQQVNVALRQMPRGSGLGGNLWDGKTLSAWIQRQYGIHLGVRQCQRLFRQLGFRLRKPRPAIAWADPERQQRHKKKTPSVDGGGNGRPMALDEVHFQHHGSRCRMWVPETKDPVLRHHPSDITWGILAPYDFAMGASGFAGRRRS